MIKERNKRNSIKCLHWLSEEKKVGNRKKIVGREVSFMCEMRERENIQEMYKDDS